MINKLRYRQENGQRIYEPNQWIGPPPGRGCEVFIGRIPRDCYGDELQPIMSSVGTVFKIRLMMDFSGFNRGFCFVVFATREQALHAVKQLDGYAIRPGCFIGACISVDNARLTVGGIPVGIPLEEVLRRFREVVNDVIRVDFPAGHHDRSSVVIEFASHRAATMARRRLIPGPVNFWGQDLVIDWAESDDNANKNAKKKLKRINAKKKNYKKSTFLNVALLNWDENLQHLCQTYQWGEPIYEMESVSTITGMKYYCGSVTCPDVGLPLFSEPRICGPITVNVLCCYPSQMRQIVAKEAWRILNESLGPQVRHHISSSLSPELRNDNSSSYSGNSASSSVMDKSFVYTNEEGLMTSHSVPSMNWFRK